MLSLAKDVLGKFLDDLDSKIANRMGISSGFFDLDSMMGYWLPETLNFVGGVPGMGCSELLNGFCLNALKSHSDIHVAYFTPILSNSQWIGMLVSNEGKIDYQRLQKGDLGEDEKDRVMHVGRILNRIGNRLFHSSEMFLTCEEIKSECLRIKENWRLDLIIVDDFNSIVGEHKAASLKEIAKELSIPVICSVSLDHNRINNRADKRPKIGDLPSNEDIYKLADRTLFLYRDEFYNPDTDYVGKSELIFFNEHFGGKSYLAWLPSFCSFHNMLE